MRNQKSKKLVNFLINVPSCEQKYHFLCTSGFEEHGFEKLFPSSTNHWCVFRFNLKEILIEGKKSKKITKFCCPGQNYWIKNIKSMYIQYSMCLM